MPCRDKTIDYLKAYGYNVVRLPKAELRPLELLYGDSRELDRFGQLNTVLIGDGTVTLPPVSADTPAAQISGQQTSELKVGIGLSILGGIIAAMGGSNLGLKATYGQAATIVFEFSDVYENSVEVAALDRYLASADVDPLSRTGAQLLENDEMFVITSTLKSDKIMVCAQTSRSGSLSLDVPVVQQAVGANVTVSAAATDVRTLTYTGTQPLVFGFQAVRLFYDDGVFRAIAPAQDVTARALSEVAPDGAQRYLADAALLRVNG